jgi:hypothetical protein
LDSTFVYFRRAREILFSYFSILQCPSMVLAFLFCLTHNFLTAKFLLFQSLPTLSYLHGSAFLMACSESFSVIAEGDTCHASSTERRKTRADLYTQ